MRREYRCTRPGSVNRITEVKPPNTEAGLAASSVLRSAPPDPALAQSSVILPPPAPPSPLVCGPALGGGETAKRESTERRSLGSGAGRSLSGREAGTPTPKAGSPHPPAHSAGYEERLPTPSAARASVPSGQGAPPAAPGPSPASRAGARGQREALACGVVSTASLYGAPAFCQSRWWADAPPPPGSSQCGGRDTDRGL